MSWFFFFNDNGTKTEQVEQLLKQKLKTKELDMYSYVRLLQALNEYKLDELKEMLESNIREEAAKKSGNKKPFTIINSMMKKNKNSELMHNKAKELDDGRFAFIDEYRVFIADTDYGFVHMEKHEIPVVNEFLKTEFDSEVEINMEEVKAVIAFNKANKTKDPYVIKADGYIVGMSADYVKDLYDYTGNCKLKFVKTTDREAHCQKTPLFSVDENGKVLAVVLPVYLSNAWQENHDLKEKEVV